MLLKWPSNGIESRSRICRRRTKNLERCLNLGYEIFLINYKAISSSGSSTQSSSDLSIKAEKDLAVWTRKQDDMKKKTQDKKEHLLALQDKQRELNKE
jgi:hypothetical protein